MAPRTILITGGAGMLASELHTYLSSQPGYEVVALSRTQLDVSQTGAAEAAIAAYRPYCVINTAALLADESEESPEIAFATNAWAVRMLARACQRHSSILIQCSTCGLFGDEIRAYQEYDQVTLKTVYARSKYAGEEYVRGLCERYFVLRLGWLYGGSLEHRRNFVVARYREAVSGSLLESACDKHGSPTYAGDVARAIPWLLDSEEYGTYHLANQGGCTRAEYVRAIVREFGLDTEIKQVDSSHFPRKAPVPDCEMLTSLNLGYAGLPLLPPWQEALSRYVRSIADQVKT